MIPQWGYWGKQKGSLSSLTVKRQDTRPEQKVSQPWAARRFCIPDLDRLLRICSYSWNTSHLHKFLVQHGHSGKLYYMVCLTHCLCQTQGMNGTPHCHVLLGSLLEPLVFWHERPGFLWISSEVACLHFAPAWFHDQSYLFPSHRCSCIKIGYTGCYGGKRNGKHFSLSLNCGASTITNGSPWTWTSSLAASSRRQRGHVSWLCQPERISSGASRPCQVPHLPPLTRHQNFPQSTCSPYSTLPTDLLVSVGFLFTPPTGRDQEACGSVNLRSSFYML